jgi:uncharacterized oxidoreductase
MATSAVAAGKIAVQRNRRAPAPPGWIVDKDGNPTTNVQDFYNGGAILPMGGDQAHKGYVLSFMVETLSGILTGLGFGIDPQGRHNDGTFLAVFDVNAFRPLEEFKRDIAAFVAYLKKTPPAEGFTEVLYQGGNSNTARRSSADATASTLRTKPGASLQRYSRSLG